ncbi:Protein of unknown function [Clostridium cavendishii DSM 21758]|uniref:DUF2809 domain-containing protein n=1 Tax=Clostridium cavendishii DSM 21758 TaxID=1121302 RepID=A0A1M6MFN0_9CLOT|nr:DUF2809 domain-containing protein [Clostridium cavendishii]SHJ82130.1 Protein of unknown function [Clostridium cavendishii DSM 21758]
MKLNIKYILAFIILLLTEIFIALFVHDTIIRPYIGDILVVILIYTLIKGFTKKSIRHLPIYLFLFATTVEIMQYFHIVRVLHLEKHKIIATIIGDSFDLQDILCYFIGTMILIMFEKMSKNPLKTSK